jgi:ABC-type antimicrobial peptide transport system permease subunit
LVGQSLYGVMAYTVTRRTREVGIRMALGAQSTSVALLFVREAAILVGFGCLLGLPALWAFGQWVRSQLFASTRWTLSRSLWRRCYSPQ